MIQLGSRFWSKADTSGPGCWPWLAALSAKGYGRYQYEGRNRLAHQLAYIEANGPIPLGRQVDHTCLQRSCVNPAHMQLVTNQMNGENRAGAYSNSRSGIRGVFWSKNRWEVTVVSCGQKYRGGRFHSLEKAEAAAITLRNQLMTNNLLDRRRVS